MDDRVGALEREYCPPLDTALFYAIVYDYDLSNLASHDAARRALDTLKFSAEAEETSAFDPSGSSTLVQDQSCDFESPERTKSCNDDGLSGASDTPVTSITRSLESSNLSNNETSVSEETYDSGIDELSVEDKMLLLAQIFPGAKLLDIEMILKRHQGNFERSTEEILTKIFLEEDGYDTEGEKLAIPKGIDGFADTGAGSRKRKSKRKKIRSYQDYSDSTFASSGERTAGLENRWNTGQSDIKFIAARTDLSEKTVASYYYNSSATRSGAISALCKAGVKSNTQVEINDPVVGLNARQLRYDFPTIPLDKCKALIVLTHPATASAHELAKALVTTPPAPSTPNTLQPHIVPQYAKPNTSSTRFVQVHQSKPRRQVTSSTNPTIAASRADAYAAACSTAFTQASQAYRKSRSAPLMGGAVAYYASVGRDLHAKARASNSMAAEAMVEAQSSATQLDLHGATVEDAIRITRKKVENWWRSDQAEWAREGKALGGAGFRVVTGAGNHSVAGRARIFPAVKKMLQADGWRVEEGHGVLMVHGRARR